MLRLARSEPDRVAIEDGNTVLTREALLNAIGAEMAQHGEGEGPIGLLAPNGAAWCVAQLAAAFAGRTVVPLPSFFSEGQLRHVIAEAQVGTVLVTRETRRLAESFGLPFRLIDLDGSHPSATHVRPGFRQVIYTSGSTGRPKGVVHGAPQIGWSMRALSEATAASQADRYLSVLPASLLLETLCAAFIPAWVGASVVFDPDLTQSALAGDITRLAETFERRQPTTTVLVPGLLGGWTAWLREGRRRAQSSLRFVALGGAPIAPDLAQTAWSLGIPVHEGYGLSECCSVVSLNRPGERVPGTVGRPLPGLDVRIEDGEIVVRAPSVMDGYLGAASPSGVWRTGDLGDLRPDGTLTVLGRKDTLIVTSQGRNVSPEWIEALILADPRVALCGIGGHGRPALTAVLIPSAAGAAWFGSASQNDVQAFVARLCRSAPDHAMPAHCLVQHVAEARDNGLISAGGRISRPALEGLIARSETASPVSA
ncbi:MAG: AMP-binding protein [Alsobacter sp.]